jgi:hypothetical protein
MPPPLPVGPANVYHRCKDVCAIVLKYSAAIGATFILVETSSAL